MKLEEIQKLITQEHDRTVKEIGKVCNQDRRTLNRTVKLMEEVGELSNEILASLDMQRPEKLSKYKKENIADEIADVIIVTLLIAENIQIDAFDSVIQKLERIKLRMPSK